MYNRRIEDFEYFFVLSLSGLVSRLGNLNDFLSVSILLSLVSVLNVFNVLSLSSLFKFWVL